VGARATRVVCNKEFRDTLEGGLQATATGKKGYAPSRSKKLKGHGRFEKKPTVRTVLQTYGRNKHGPAEQMLRWDICSSKAKEGRGRRVCQSRHFDPSVKTGRRTTNSKISSPHTILEPGTSLLRFKESKQMGRPGKNRCGKKAALKNSPWGREASHGASHQLKGNDKSCVDDCHMVKRRM